MEQALVFASIILGVAVAAELTNLHHLLRTSRVRWHWAQPVFALYTLLSITFFWWLIASESGSAISLGEFLPIMFRLVLFVLLAAISLPDRADDREIDLAAYYQSNKRYQWLLVVLIFGSMNVEMSIDLLASDTAAGTYFLIMGLNWLVVIAAASLMWIGRWWYVAAAYVFFSFGPLFFWIRQVLA